MRKSKKISRLDASVQSGNVMVLCNAAGESDQSVLLPGSKMVEDEVTANSQEKQSVEEEPDLTHEQDPQPENITDGDVVPSEVTPVTVVEAAVVPADTASDQNNAGGVVYQNVIFQGDPSQMGPFFPQYGVPGLPTIHSGDYQSFSTCTLPVVQSNGDLDRELRQKIIVECFI